jgi:cyclic beta-1,2-glucan synthetase
MYNKNRVSGSATLLSDSDLLRLARELSFVRCRAIRINDANLSISSEKKVLTAIYKFVIKANSKCVELPPVADTLIDNFYLVEKNLTAMSDILKVQRLPHSIPVSAEGSRNGQLRVYGIASELLAHKEYRFNEEVFYSFIREFQKIAPLGSAELELLPLMLKIVCIEQLTASALTAIQTIAEYESADEVWETLSKYSNSKRKQKEIIRQSVKTLDSAGINHLYSYLCEKDSFELISYLKDELATQSRTIEDENDLHIQRQSDSHRIAANAINSLKFIDTMNWEQAYNALSVVREALSADELYNNMNLTSKKKYAEIVSKIALDLDVTEAAVAMRAVNLAVNRFTAYSFLLHALRFR